MATVVKFPLQEDVIESADALLIHLNYSGIADPRWKSYFEHAHPLFRIWIQRCCRVMSCAEISIRSIACPDTTKPVALVKAFPDNLIAESVGLIRSAIGASCHGLSEITSIGVIGQWSDKYQKTIDEHFSEWSGDFYFFDPQDVKEETP